MHPVMFSVVTKYHKGRHSLFLYNSEIFYAFTQDILRSLFHTVRVKWQVTNQSDGSRKVFFLKMLDTALNDQSGHGYNDSVPIYYLGNGQGLFIKDSTGQYKFEVYTDVSNGPDGLNAAYAKANYYPLIGVNESTLFSYDDPGMINNSAPEGKEVINTTGVEDTSINMLWFPRTMAKGDTMTMEYDVHATPVEAKAPELEVDQAPATFFKKGALNVSGTIKDEDNANQAEKLYYRVNDGAAGADNDGWVYATEVNNQPTNTAHKFSFSVPEGNFAVGDTVNIRLVDYDGNIKQETVKIVQPTSNATLTKKVRNVTQNEDSFKQETNADSDDVVEYRVEINPGTVGLATSFSTLRDSFDDALTPTKDVELSYYKKESSPEPTKTTLKWKGNKLSRDNGFDIGFPANKPIVLKYKAKVNQTDKEKIDNYAELHSNYLGGDSSGEVHVKNDTPATVKLNTKGEITVKYVDEDGNLLTGTRKNNAGDPVSVTGETKYQGKIGQTPADTADVGLIQPPDLSHFTPDSGDDAGNEQNYTVVQSYSGGVSDANDVPENDWIQPAVDYGSAADKGNDSKTITFQKDPQTIIYQYHKSYISMKAPTDWEFGTFTTNPSDKTFYLQTKKNKQAVEVEDYFTTKNWKLSVQQLDKFRSSEGYVLDGAQLRLNHGQVALSDNDTIAQDVFDEQENHNYTSQATLEPEKPVDLMWVKNNKAEKGQYATHDFGTWHYKFGDDKTANTSIGLFVPESTKRYETHYETTLNWTLQTAE